MKERIAELVSKIARAESMGVDATDMAIAEILDLLLDLDARIEHIERQEGPL